MSQKSLTVSEAVASRRSIRAFTSQAVDMAALQSVLETALWAPSGGNLQPWQIEIVTSKTLKLICDKVTAKAISQPLGESDEYEIYPRPLSSPYRDRRYSVGETLYQTIGISRDDTKGRAQQFLANYNAFGAPCVIFAYIHRDHGMPQWSDMGMFLQTIMLLLREQGLDSCAQESWSRYAATISEILNPAPELMLFAGLSVGYRDCEAAINSFVSKRVPLAEVARFHT